VFCERKRTKQGCGWGADTHFTPNETLSLEEKVPSKGQRHAPPVRLEAETAEHFEDASPDAARQQAKTKGQQALRPGA
jgi:hypothetical protein